MTKAQWKEKNRAARICRNSQQFMYYDMEEPIPESLQPYLVKKQRFLLSQGVRRYEKGNPKSYEWIRSQIRNQVYGY